MNFFFFFFFFAKNLCLVGLRDCWRTTVPANMSYEAKNRRTVRCWPIRLTQEAIRPTMAMRCFRSKPPGGAGPAVEEEEDCKRVH